MDFVPKWLAERGLRDNLGRANASCRKPDGTYYSDTEMFKSIYGTPVSLYMNYQFKMRKLMNPNELGGSYYKALDPDFIPEKQ